MKRPKSIFAWYAAIAVPLLSACGGGPMELAPGELNTNPRVEDNQDLNSSVTAGPIEWRLVAVDTVGDAEARKTRGTYIISFRNNILDPVDFNYRLVFYDSANNEVDRTKSFSLNLGAVERRIRAGNFTLENVETIGEANRIDRMQVVDVGG